ncbi:MAG: crotonyl-CoA carboxylase/reductase, partial [Actinobacteria bacterium]|nr:crotonyl-CoA carboxylase/reductase [Actinomycetota bacterium]
MKSILEAIENNADTKAFSALQMPETYRAAVVLKDEQDMFAGVASADKDPRKSVHIQQV